MKDVHVPTPGLRTIPAGHSIDVVAATGSSPDLALAALRDAAQKRGDRHARGLPAEWWPDVKPANPGSSLIWFFEVTGVRLLPPSDASPVWCAYGTLTARSRHPLTFAESESAEHGDWPDWYIPVPARD